MFGRENRGGEKDVGSKGSTNDNDAFVAYRVGGVLLIRSDLIDI